MFIFLILALFLVPSQQKSVAEYSSQSRSTLVRSPRALKFSNLSQLSNVTDDKKRDAYRYQQTVVIQTKGIIDNVVYECEMVEVYDDKAVRNTTLTLTVKHDLKIKEVSINEIYKKMIECDALDSEDKEKFEDNQENFASLFGDDEENSISEYAALDKSKSRAIAIFHGIFPGTKWCGFGDIATKYHDLGKLHNVDRCCRTHDFCPIHILSGDKKFNLTNDAKYTKSNCICDETFFKCLKADKGYSASLLGNLYFRIANPECIKGIPENRSEKMKFVPATSKW